MFQKVKHDFIQRTESGEFQLNSPLEFRSLKSIKDEKSNLDEIEQKIESIRNANSKPARRRG